MWVVWVVTAVIYLLFPSWLEEIPSDDIANAQTAFVLVAVITGLSFAPTILELSAFAKQRFDIQNALDLALQTLGVAVVVGALWAGYGLMGVAIAHSTRILLSVVAKVIMAFVLMPKLRLSPHRANVGSLRELLGYSIFGFLINSSERIVLFTDAVVECIGVSRSSHV